MGLWGEGRGDSVWGDQCTSDGRRDAARPAAGTAALLTTHRCTISAMKRIAVLAAILVFAACKQPDAPSPPRKLYGADDGGYDRAAGLDDRAEGTNYTVFGGGGGVVGIFKLAANTPYLTVDSYDQPKKLLNVWVNGAPAKQNQQIDHGASLDKFYIGGSGTVYHEAWLGNVAEMLVYRRILTDDERKKVEDYLAAKYGLKLTR